MCTVDFFNVAQSFTGAALIFCGFDIVASKVASIVVGVAFLMTLWWARKDWLTILTIVFAVGVIVAFWLLYPKSKSDLIGRRGALPSNAPELESRL